MGEQMEVYPPGLRKSGKGLGDTGNKVHAAWQDLQNTVTGMGQLFGDDMVSSLIGASYQAAHQMAHESFTSAADGLNGFGEGLTTMADVYDTTEDATTGQADALGREV